MPGWLLRDLEIMFQHFLNHGLLATQAEIDGLAALLGHAPRSYEAFIREVLPLDAGPLPESFRLRRAHGNVHRARCPLVHSDWPSFNHANHCGRRRDGL